MAYGDTKSVKYRGGGGWGSSSYYDDEGRGRSKDLYERFCELWEGHKADRLDFLFNAEKLTNDFLWNLWKNTTWRFNLHDFCDNVNWSDSDGRVKRMIVKQFSDKTWSRFVEERLKPLNEIEKERVWMEQLASGIKSIIRQHEYKVEEKKRIAAKLEKLEQETTELYQRVELTAGTLRSDFFEATRAKERYGQFDGDWIDDPVAGYMGTGGFGEEYRTSTGIKLQVTLSMDISNSMRHNKVSEAASQAYLELGLAIKQLAEENAGSVFYAFFEFSGEEDGKHAKRLTDEKQWYNSYDGVHADEGEEFYLEELEQVRHGFRYDGEDTWMYPLFEKIEKWENGHSDPGAIKIDLIISDAVLEHPTDLSKSSVIQERRDGMLQTIVLNLMPEKHWHGGALPMRCVQYAANPDNLAGLMRNILMDVVNTYI